MIQPALALLALSLALPGTTKDGENLLKQAEERLYRWPSPGVLVRFEAHTDVLAPMLASMRRDLEKRPDAEASRLVDALEHAAIHGTIDTETGKVTTDVGVAYTSSDARTTAAIDQIKSRLSITISGCFQGLPLNDPVLLHKGSKVLTCEDGVESIQVTLSSTRPGETTRLKFGRQSLLPETIETSAFTGKYHFAEVCPGRFAPDRLDLTPRGGPESHAEYSYQKQGELFFPAKVQVSSRGESAAITFTSLEIEPRAH